ncbi:MAG: membrane protein insertion efficiency factor YidD [Marinifilaceae bacterium]|jgi:putative membrane protein insertion efficiency factor|nr:membrane protein insertion efficiency factor YidD [Marinifilaceae bacterium]
MPNLKKYLLINSIVIVWITVLAQNTFSQLNKDDLLLITKHKCKDDYGKRKERAYIFANRSAFIKFNPISLSFGGLMYFYQNVLSQQFSADCLYYPTCSDFSKQAISKYGLIKGVFLSADRLTRCNRIAATGLHPLKINIDTNHAYDGIEFYNFRNNKNCSCHHK